jgi:hypothetical protein
MQLNVPAMWGISRKGLDANHEWSMSYVGLEWFLSR